MIARQIESSQEDRRLRHSRFESNFERCESRTDYLRGLRTLSYRCADTVRKVKKTREVCVTGDSWPWELRNAARAGKRDEVEDEREFYSEWKQGGGLERRCRRAQAETVKKRWDIGWDVHTMQRATNRFSEGPFYSLVAMNDRLFTVGPYSSLIPLQS